MSSIPKKDAYYFSHDANAKDDFKCMLLIEELGLEGYGIFWVLVETLREQENYKYPFRLLPSLARKYNTTQAKMEVVVKSYGLFQLDAENFFFSKSLNQRMQLMDKSREQRRLEGIASGKARSKNSKKKPKNERSLNGCSTVAEQIKENKVKVNKRNEKETSILEVAEILKNSEIEKLKIKEDLKI
ncbi:MAG: DUF4373 domain-containing protein, partial [Arcobacteraceae bacterium]|nr:DUF4373 domain-containing protein [Arcobacteraceae bacterium]